MAEKELVALLDKVSNSVGILQDVTGSETLVGLRSRAVVQVQETTDHVEEGEVLLLLDNVTELPPLGLGGVDTGGVLILARHRKEVIIVRVHRRGARSESHQLYSQATALRTMDPSGAALMSAFMPSKSRPTVFLSK